MDLRIGQVLVETYRIDRLIAEGGMGSVYEASHLRVPKRFAVKFLNLALVDKTEALVRFRREAEIIATLDHPNIVTLFDYNVTDDGVPYIVLEFLDGEHLGKRLDKGKLSLRESVRILVPVCHALGAAHKRNIIHRDLKPENVILCKDDVVKVVDFGIAKIRGFDLTGMNSIIGTVPYMAPEQINGGTVDGRTDQFALATILYEMLSGEMAFGGSQSVPEVAMKVMHYQPPFLDEVSQGINERLFKAMSKDPTARYPSLDAFVEALLEAASMPDTTPSVASDELPPLPGEATTVTRMRPLDIISGAIDKAQAERKAGTGRPEQPTPAPLPRDILSDKTGPLARAAGDGEPDTDELPPLAEQPTAVTRGQSDGGDGAQESEGERPGDVNRFRPLVTQNIPSTELRPPSDDKTPTTDAPFAAPETTAVTREPRRPEAILATAQITNPLEAPLPGDATVQRPAAEIHRRPTMPLAAKDVDDTSDASVPTPRVRPVPPWVLALLAAVTTLFVGLLLRHFLG